MGREGTWESREPFEGNLARGDSSGGRPTWGDTWPEPTTAQSARICRPMRVKEDTAPLSCPFLMCDNSTFLLVWGIIVSNEFPAHETREHGNRITTDISPIAVTH